MKQEEEEQRRMKKNKEERRRRRKEEDGETGIFAIYQEIMKITAYALTMLKDTLGGFST